VIFAANDMRDLEVDVVHHRGQRVEEAAILADEHGVGEMRRVDLDIAAHQIVPLHLALRELEAPMGFAALAFQPGAVFGGEFQRGAVIDRRLVRRDLPLAAAVQLVGGFIGRIEMAARLQRFGGAGMGIGPLDLAREDVVRHAQPRHIFQDRGFIFRLAALGIGVIDAQEEFAVMLLREQPVEHGRARIADMEQPGGGWGETDDGHSLSSPASGA
jgi:hypothetical protein